MRALRMLAVCAALCAAAPFARGQASEPEPRAALGHSIEDERSRLAALRRSDRDFALGLAAQDHADLEGAAEAYRRALAADPAFVEARVNLARVLLAQGELEKARAQLDRALEARSDYPPAYAARGLLALFAGDLGRARNELERAVRLDPDGVEARVNLAAVYLRQRELAAARAQLERALERAPYSPEAVLNRALLEDQSGQLADAVYYYDLFLGLGAVPTERRAAVESRLRELVAGAALPVAEEPR